MSPSSNSNPHISFEIISTEILHRLDIKTLTLSTSVSKQWNSLITTPSFVSYHFLCNIGKIPESLFFHICLTQTDSLLKRLFHFQETYYINNNNNNSSSLLVPPLTPFPSPPLDRFKNKDSFLSVVGICNGLVFLVDDNVFSYILWNPSVRKYMLLPRLGGGKSEGFDIEAVQDFGGNDFEGNIGVGV